MIEEFVAQFEGMEQEEMAIANEMKQFWKSVIQDDQLEQLAKQVREAEAQLMTLKMLLQTMPLMVQITCSKYLKDLQQRAARAQERQHKSNTQLDEFQDIGGQLSVKAVVELQVVQAGRKMVDGKVKEDHPLKKELLNCWDTVE